MLSTGTILAVFSSATLAVTWGYPDIPRWGAGVTGLCIAIAYVVGLRSLVSQGKLSPDASLPSPYPLTSGSSSGVFDAKNVEEVETPGKEGKRKDKGKEEEEEEEGEDGKEEDGEEGKRHKRRRRKRRRHSGEEGEKGGQVALPHKVRVRKRVRRPAEQDALDGVPKLRPRDFFCPWVLPVKVTNTHGYPVNIEPNTRVPLPYDNEYFGGHCSLVFRADPPDPHFASLFELANTIFEIQLQGRLKTKTRGTLYMGIEAMGPVSMGIIGRALGKILLKIIRSQTRGMDGTFNEDDDLRPHIVFPMAMFADVFKFYKDGEDVPDIGTRLECEPPEEAAARKKAATVDDRYGPDSGTLIMSYKSPRIDMIEWKIRDIPGMKDVQFAPYLAGLGLQIVGYDMPEGWKGIHYDSAKRYYFCFTIENTGAGVQIRKSYPQSVPIEYTLARSDPRYDAALSGGGIAQHEYEYEYEYEMIGGGERDNESFWSSDDRDEDDEDDEDEDDEDEDDDHDLERVDSLFSPELSTSLKTTELKYTSITVPALIEYYRDNKRRVLYVVEAIPATSGPSVAHGAAFLPEYNDNQVAIEPSSSTVSYIPEAPSEKSGKRHRRHRRHRHRHSSRSRRSRRSKGKGKDEVSSMVSSSSLTSGGEDSSSELGLVVDVGFKDKDVIQLDEEEESGGAAHMGKEIGGGGDGSGGGGGGGDGDGGDGDGGDDDDDGEEEEEDSMSSSFSRSSAWEEVETLQTPVPKRSRRRLATGRTTLAVPDDKKLERSSSQTSLGSFGGGGGGGSRSRSGSISDDESWGGGSVRSRSMASSRSGSGSDSGGGGFGRIKAGRSVSGRRAESSRHPVQLTRKMLGQFSGEYERDTAVVPDIPGTVRTLRTYEDIRDLEAHFRSHSISRKGLKNPKVKRYSRLAKEQNSLNTFFATVTSTRAPAAQQLLALFMSGSRSGRVETRYFLSGMREQKSANLSTQVSFHASVVRALDETYWREETVLLYSENISFAQFKKKARLHKRQRIQEHVTMVIALEDVLSIGPLEGPNVPFDGYAFVTIVTLERVHYVCMANNSVADEFIRAVAGAAQKLKSSRKALGSGIGQHDPVGSSAGSAQAPYVYAVPRFRSRLLLNGRRLVFHAKTPSLVSGAAPWEVVGELLGYGAGLVGEGLGTDGVNAFLDATVELKRLRLGASVWTHNETVSFFLNAYHLLVIHALLVLGTPTSKKEARKLYSDYSYQLGEFVFSPLEIEHAILRAASHSSSSSKSKDLLSKTRAKVSKLSGVSKLSKLRSKEPVPKFEESDPRSRFVVRRSDWRLSLAIITGSFRSVMEFPIYHPDRLDSQLNAATSAYLNRFTAISEATGVVSLPEPCEKLVSGLGATNLAVLRRLEPFYRGSLLRSLQTVLNSRNTTVSIKFEEEAKGERLRFHPGFGIIQ